MKNLHDSFKDYIQVETLDGENKYQAEGYGLQDAKKGIIFQSFPPAVQGGNGGGPPGTSPTGPPGRGGGGKRRRGDRGDSPGATRSKAPRAEP